jgi:serine protease Do
MTGQLEGPQRFRGWIRRPRKGLWPPLLAVWIAVLLAGPAQGAQPTADLPTVVAAALPGVVNISIIRLEPEPYPAPGAPAVHQVLEEGSGFVIDPSGLIVTNRHLVESAIAITAVFQDGTRLAAALVGTGQRLDVALLRVAPTEKLTALHFGRSDKLRIGETVMAIGNPLGLGASVSAGIVSALNRDIGETIFDDFVQTDAAINHGCSGGPLLNASGEVVGINTAFDSATPSGGSIGIGFALPSDAAAIVVDRLRQYGRSWVGVIGALFQQVTPDVAAALGEPELHGDTVTSVPMLHGDIVTSIRAGGPAEQAGLRIGDVVTAAGNRMPTDERALLRIIAGWPIGSKIPLSVWRAGTELTIAPVVTALPVPAQQPAVAPPSSGPSKLGLGLAVLTPELRAKYRQARNDTGVAVVSVEPGSVAAQLGLGPGDVILRVGLREITRTKEAEQAIEEAESNGRPYVLLLVHGREGRRWYALPLHPRTP